MEKLVDICFNATHKSFEKDLDLVLKQASDVGVDRMILPGSSADDSNLAVALARKFPKQLRVATGVHPHLAREWNANTEAVLRNLTLDETVVAVGEAGLDYNRNYSAPEQQLTVFERQIKLAVETELPLFMHQRDAHEDFIALLKPYRKDLTKAVVHCFTGNEYELEDYLKMDLHIGMTGWICDERRGGHLKKIIRQIPHDRLMLETDAPYLLPRNMPKKPRSRRNEPAFLRHIAEEIADCLSTDIASLAKQTTENALRFFNWI